MASQDSSPQTTLARIGIRLASWSATYLRNFAKQIRLAISSIRAYLSKIRDLLLSAWQRVKQFAFSIYDFYVRLEKGLAERATDFLHIIWAVRYLSLLLFLEILLLYWAYTWNPLWLLAALSWGALLAKVAIDTNGTEREHLPEEAWNAPTREFAVGATRWIIRLSMAGLSLYYTSPAIRSFVEPALRRVLAVSSVGIGEQSQHHLSVQATVDAHRSPDEHQEMPVSGDAGELSAWASPDTQTSDPHGPGPTAATFHGECPGEGSCSFFRWIVERDTPLFEEPNTGTPKATVAAGEVVQGLTAVIHTIKPGKIRITANDQNSANSEPSFEVRKDQEFATYYFRGEGCWPIWYRGGHHTLCATHEVIEDPKFDWWVKLRVESGVEGWSDTPGHFCGWSKYQECQPIAPSS